MTIKLKNNMLSNFRYQTKYKSINGACVVNFSSEDIPTYKGMARYIDFFFFYHASKMY